ncbi:Nonribosomal peptide synthetase 8 [Colletotrichum sidae]|uniref:Nonribosomal peptide synthetase 8 n=1 Tax=Colletotrichum sidae TaxID=1347389 RepID=A0A4R8TL96_9PEZI|nr:Nonribosomal peptide synthetase 8 [Colletotrichum sidae]
MNGTSAEETVDVPRVLGILKQLCAGVLSIPSETIDDGTSFVTLGGDSFKAVHLFQKCTDRGLGVRFQDILHKPLREVALLARPAGQQDESTTFSRQKRTGHGTFPQMPADYDFNKIFSELEEKYSLSENDIEDVYPCSPMQESMYIGQKMSSQRLYRTRGLFEVQTSLDIEVFKRTWNDIVLRHQTLRTVYVETSDLTSGRLLDAVVLRTKPGRVTVKSCDSFENLHQAFQSVGEGSEHSDEDSQHQITIYTDKQANGKTMLEMDLNHLTVDGSSLMIIIDELMKGIQGRPVGGPATGYGRYIDYVQNQVDEDAALDYWIDYLDGAEPCHFPTLNDNISGAGGSFEVLEVPLSTSLQDLRTFCQAHNATISNCLQAVWALVLHVYAGDPDVCFGYLSSGRSLPIPGVSEIVGPMMNLLVCRVGGIDGKSLTHLLGGIRDDFVNALPHQCFSIGKVQRVLGTNESKLFNTIMTSYYSPAVSCDESNSLFKLVASHNASDFDLVLKVVYSDSHIRVRLAFSKATLSPAMGKGVSQTLSAILQRLVETPDLGISVKGVTALGQEAFDTVTHWSAQNTPEDDIPSSCVHQLIEERARLQPRESAIYAWDGEMTYMELDEAATHLAGHMVNLGIGPGAFVPLCFEKSKWYSVALLAVMKSGNAFVPLDLSNPASRKQDILRQLSISRDSGLVLCSRSQTQDFAAISQRVCPVDADELSTIRSRKHSYQPPAVSPTDPVYVIFTSGSTGRPKGVVVTHASYAYAARAHSAGIHLTPSSRVLQFASYGFDTSMEDHVTTLARGACLCVPSEEARVSIPDLAAFATASRANWAHLTPSFAELVTPAMLPTVKTMVLGGEAMSGKNVATWADAGQTELIQVYGPSECCVTSTISPVMGPNADPTNIGSAVPGCGTWVANPDDPNRLQAIGAVGELLVEGPILARGYLGDIEQTTEAFVTGLAWAPEKRLYRTGDLVKYDSSGQLHFVGRRDGRIKLRGQRIELGEVERQLVLESTVQHCLAVVPDAGPCAKQLVILVVLADYGSPSTLSTPSASIDVLHVSWAEHISRMREFLLDRIPPYMTPEVWILLESVPRNSSGKLDRKRVARYLESLTQDEYAKLASLMEEESAARPGSETELLLREIWCEVLNVSEEEIGWTTSFYYLGGDSISAMTVSSVARQKGLLVSAADVLRYRTIERLSKSITSPAEDAPKPAEEAETHLEQWFPLSPIQQLHFQASPDGDLLDQQTMVLELTREVSQDMLLNGLESLLEAHPMLRARFERRDGEWKQTIPGVGETCGSRVRFHSRDHLDYVTECIAEAKRSLDLSDGPLIGLDVFETDRRTLLSVTIHHLIIDAVSWRILFRELENFLLFGKRPDPETSSFQSWCNLQREHASGLKTREELPTSDPVPVSDLVFWDMKDKKNRFGDAVTHTVDFDAEFTKSLSSTRDTAGFAALDVMITAIVYSFHEIFGRSPAVFVEGHGRESLSPEVDTSSTVGWFTTFSPVVAQHHGDRMTTLNNVREYRSSTPLNGLSYFTSRFLTPPGGASSKHRHWPMEVTLNHLGAFQQVERHDSLFKRCEEGLQSRLSEMRRKQRANSTRYALISILAITKDDKMSIEIEWNSQMSHQDQLKDWVSSLEQTLKHTTDRLASQVLPSSPVESLPFSVGIKSKKLNSVMDLAKSRLGLRLSEIQAVYPCSPIQDSLMLSQLKEPTDVYSQHFLFKLSSQKQLDPRRLAASWKQVVATHHILRTVFLEGEDGTFLQIVLKSVTPAIEIMPLEDESTLPAIWARHSSSTGPSPLSGKVLHKLKVYTTSSGAVYCLLDKNHIITDGTTSRLLIRNFMDTYEGRKRADVCPYANYIKYTSEQDMKEINRYWTHYLDGAVACHFPKLSQSKLSPDARVEFARTTSVSEKVPLEAASRKLDVTLPTILQAAWAVVLSTYLNSDDVVFGLLCHGRDAPIAGAQEIIGPMASIVPIRARLTSKTTVSKVLTALQEDSISHLSRQAVSLARIQHAVRRSGEPMFNTIFNFQKTGTASPSSSIKAELLFAHDTSEYDIAVCVTEDRGRLDITLEFPKHFMSEDQSQRLIAVYTNALRSLIRDPGASVGHLDLSTDLDKDQLLEWNSGDLEVSKRCIHEMISETTLRQPSRPAISAWDGDMSYAQLDLLSTKLAAQLQAIGAKPEEVITLCFEKSVWAVVSMLAVAKSGAAFVHIDPKGAPKRTEFVIKQTKSRIGLASLEQYDNLISLVDTILIVNKPSVMGLPTPRTTDVVSSSAEPSNTLYIIFTSGTTGTPKGVVIQHRSFCSAVVANKASLHIKATSRVLQFTNFCFDASLEEIFTVLVAGGCICIPSEKQRMSNITAFIEQKKVNWAAFTPSFLRTLNPDGLKTVKFITVHAEPMGQDLVARWAGKIHTRPSYGPTECSVTSTVGGRFSTDTDATNIGFTVGCRGWVVNPDNHDVLMPIGAVGELLLDGPNVGKGYLHDEAKTDAAFIDPPAWSIDTEPSFSAPFDRKMYKTGDLVRYAEDGSLLIQRRKDHSQVKIRGQRVELSEIQHHLDNLSSVIRHSMVLMPRAGLLKGRLVAVASLTHLATALDTRNTAYQAVRILDAQALGGDGRGKVAGALDEITSTLERQLPQYMIPETWLVVQSLPVQLSLKLDRQRVTGWVEEIDKAKLQSALDLVSRNGPQRERGSDSEETIRGVWGDVLGIDTDRIALDQSFFRLGGDSIFAMRVMKLCCRAGLQITTQDVLANPTIRQLAAVAVPSKPRESAVLSPPQSPYEIQMPSYFARRALFQDKTAETIVPCSPFQERMYRSFLKRPQQPYLFNSLVALEGLGDGADMDLDGLLAAWQHTVDRHAILRTVFFTDATDRLFQKILAKHKTDISVSSVQSEESARRQAQHHLNATRSRLFKDGSPPLSVRLFVTPDRLVSVHFIMAHIMIDHVSLSRVFRDFADFCQGKTPPPVDQSSGFDKYINHLTRNRDLAVSNLFWVEVLKDVKPYMVPSEMMSNSKIDPHAMGAVNFQIDVTDGMRGYLRGAGVTLSNLLQFTWALVLHVCTGRSTVCFGHLVSDRDIDLPHVDDIVGPLLSIMVARTSFEESANLLDSLRVFQSESIHSLRHKTFDLTDVERQLGCEGTGLFNTLVNYRKVQYSGESADVKFRSIWKQDPHEQLLVLAFNEGPSRLDASLTYYEALFSKQTLATLTGTYCRILRLLVSGQCVTVEELKSMLSS